MSLEHLAFLLNVLSALVLPIGYFLWNQVASIRENDLKHLEENHQEVVHRLTQIDEKLERHLDFSESLHRETENRLSVLESKLPPLPSA